MHLWQQECSSSLLHCCDRIACHCLRVDQLLYLHLLDDGAGLRGDMPGADMLQGCMEQGPRCLPGGVLWDFSGNRSLGDGETSLLCALSSHHLIEFDDHLLWIRVRVKVLLLSSSIYRRSENEACWGEGGPH